jgi:uncharacterized protein involved in exopolysaccharide biosynthesis
MSLFQILRILWARRAILLVSLISALIAALLIVRLMPTRYEAESRVMLDLIKPDPVSGLGMSAGQVRGYVKTQTELIRDYRVAGNVVDALGWTKSPIYAAAYARRAKTDNRDFRRFVADTVSANTDVRLIEASNILEITYTSSTPTSARVIADALRQAYIDQTLSFRQQSAAKTAEWFGRQAAKLRAELTLAEKRKTDFERANGVLLVDDQTDAQEARLKALAATPPMAAMPSAPTMAASAPSAAALAQLDAQIAVASRTLGPNHPDLIALQRQRGALAQSVSTELAAARSGSRGGSSGPSQEALYASQRSKVLAQRGLVDEAQQLAVDVKLLRDQYDRTATRWAEQQQQAQSTETGITVLGSAVAPSRPSFPNVPLILIGGAGLGLALGVLAALLVELLSRKVRGADDLRIGDIPLIGVMAREPDRITGRSLPRLLGFGSGKA